MSPTFIDVTTEHITAISRGIFIFYMRKLPTSGRLLRIRQDIDLAGKRGLRGYFQIMHPRDGRPPAIDEDIRKSWVGLAEAAKRNADVGAIAILQAGFGGAALRAAVSTVLLLSRGQKPARVFDKIETASRWLAEQLRAAPGGPSEEEILAAVQEISAKLD